MESLFAITINGTMLYVIGELSEQECIEIETIAKNIKTTEIKNTIDYNEIYNYFFKLVFSKIHVKLKPINIERVFRINL